jgi:hypothetical protein
MSNETMNEAIAALRKDKIIIKRPISTSGPGRQWQAGAMFSQVFARKQVTQIQVVEAVQFKRLLDSEFSSGKSCVHTDYMAGEGTALCITQLQAHGRIRLQGVNIPMDKFGWAEDADRADRIPKSTFHFQIEIYPTATYVYDDNNPSLRDALMAEPPRGGSGGEIPVWYGITDKLISDIWGKVIVAFSGIVALRPGSKVEALTNDFNSTLEEWEVRRLLEWGVKVGLFKRIHEEVEGWAVTEWWWATTGRYCET